MKVKFKVGDKVRIRQWDDMKKEFKVDCDGDIIMNNCWFSKGMKHLCGRTAEIDNIDSEGKIQLINWSCDDNTDWYFCGDMLELFNEEITINRYNNKVVAKLGKKVGVARCCPDDEFDLYTGSKLALDRLFGKEEKEVKEVYRTAKVGEWIKIVAARCAYGQYSNGDILLVDQCGWTNTYVNIKGITPGILTEEYIVLENYIPPKKEVKKEERNQSYNGKIVCIENNETFFTIGKIYDVKDGKFQGDELDTWSNDGNLFRCLHQINTYFSNPTTYHAKFVELVED